MQAGLSARAALQYSEPALGEMARATKVAVSRARAVLGAASVANAAAGTLRRLRGGQAARRRQPPIDPSTQGA